MAETLMFRQLFHYPLDQIGITIPLRCSRAASSPFSQPK
jgi:hypothetical protein